MASDGPLYEKFIVHRTDKADEPGGKHDGCALFVLDLTHDPHARIAARAYARSVELTHPTLATDLRALADRSWIAEELAKLPPEDGV